MGTHERYLNRCIKGNYNGLNIDRKLEVCYLLLFGELNE